MKLNEKILCSNGCKKAYHQIGREPLPDCNRTKVAQLEVLQKACIEFYCGTITKFKWRQAVRESPEGQRLIALADLYGVK